MLKFSQSMLLPILIPTKCLFLQCKNNLNVSEMKEELKVFEDVRFGKIRTVMDGENLCFVAKDVCDILGHTNHRRALQALDEDEKGVTKCYTPGGEQEMSTVSESGLYSLIFRSNLPNARAFRKWVTSEVLPSIRKIGKYEIPKVTQALPLFTDIFLMKYKPGSAKYEKLQELYAIAPQIIEKWHRTRKTSLWLSEIMDIMEGLGVQCLPSDMGRETMRLIIEVMQNSGYQVIMTSQQGTYMLVKADPELRRDINAYIKENDWNISYETVVKEYIANYSKQFHCVPRIEKICIEFNERLKNL